MGSLLHICPCSQLFSVIPSNGSRLRDYQKRRVELQLRGKPISDQFHGSTTRCQSEISVSSAVDEKQEGQSSAQSVTKGIQRRQVVLRGLVAALTVPTSANPAYASPSGSSDLTSAAAVPTAEQVDEINAYSYVYPVALEKQASTIRWVESRKPERYSSAAPLSPDARQRIVSERLNFQNNLVVSVSVGPPNSTFLKSSDPNVWSAQDVARSVLADKSTARMTTGQRVAEVSILDTHAEERDGVRYWYYEYVVQKSPTIKDRTLDVFRHSSAVTAEREGYLYSLNASTSSKNWSRIAPMFKESIASFRLLPPTSEYVPPYKDPWRFW